MSNQYTNTDLLTRFYGNWTVDPITGCWNWSGVISRYGYGIIGSRRRTMRAHRISWLLFNGPIPDGLFICHKCDNKRCVNPDHLFLGTCKDNVVDHWNKGGHQNVFGEEHYNAKLTDIQVEDIKDLCLCFGMKQHNVARIYDVGDNQISRIVRGRERVAAKQIAIELGGK
jgi:hypothetical protein